MKCYNRRCQEDIPLEGPHTNDGDLPLFALCDSCAAAAWLGFKCGGVLMAFLGFLFGVGAWLAR